jgi:hypothetical protein
MTTCGAHGMSEAGFAIVTELLSTDDIAGQVIAAKGFDAADAILRAPIRKQVGSIVKRLHRPGSMFSQQ